MSPENRFIEIGRIGQSIWYDGISRSMLTSGKLKALAGIGIRGLTTNPAAFRNAVASDPEYAAVIEELKSYGLGIFDIYDDLTTQSIQAAADVFLPMYEDTEGADGYVSIQINPHLSANTQATLDEARRLAGKINRPNVMIKIPATSHGFPAIEKLIAEGVNVNATLVFCLRQYEMVSQAYMNGMKALLKSGRDPRKVHSVASVFVGAVDETVDDLIEGLVRPMTDEMHKKDLRELKSRAAVANATVLYRRFREVFSGEQFRQISSQGAGIQRIAWASMEPSSGAVSPHKYVDELLAKDTVCTVPQKVLDSLLGQAQIKAMQPLDRREVDQVIGRLRRLWIDVEEICDRLLEDNIKDFRNSFDDLLALIATKAKQR